MESFSLGLLALHLWGLVYVVVFGRLAMGMSPNPHVRVKAGFALIVAGYLAGAPVYFTSDTTVLILGAATFLALFIAGILLIALAPRQSGRKHSPWSTNTT